MQAGLAAQLIAIAEEVVACARSALASGKRSFDDVAIAGLRDEIGHYCRSADSVIDQACRRVLESGASSQ